jgi:hypothetical protein
MLGNNAMNSGAGMIIMVMMWIKLKSGDVMVVVCSSVTKAEKGAEKKEDYLYCKAQVCHIPEFSGRF